MIHGFMDLLNAQINPTQFTHVFSTQLCVEPYRCLNRSFYYLTALSASTLILYCFLPIWHLEKPMNSSVRDDQQGVVGKLWRFAWERYSLWRKVINGKCNHDYLDWSTNSIRNYMVWVYRKALCVLGMISLSTNALKWGRVYSAVLIEFVVWLKAFEGNFIGSGGLWLLSRCRWRIVVNHLPQACYRYLFTRSCRCNHG